MIEDEVAAIAREEAAGARENTPGEGDAGMAAAEGERWGPTTRGFVAAAGMVLIALALYLLRPLFVPTIIATLVAYALNPVVKGLKRRLHLPHTLAVTVVYTTALLLLIATPSTLAPLAVREVRRVSINLNDLEREVEAFLAEPATLLGAEIQFGDVLTGLLKATTESLTPSTDGALRVLETTSISLAWLLIILVLTYYFLLDSWKLQTWLVRLAPPHAQADVDRLIKEIGAIWQAYTRGTLALMFIMGLLMTLVWAALGLPGAVPIGLLTGFLMVIPELGPFIAGVLAVLAAFFQGSNFIPLSNLWFAGLVGVVHLVMMQIRLIWIQPRIIGRYLDLHGGLIFVALISALVLQGIFGALVVVPVLASVGLIGRYVRCRLFGLDPWES